MKTKIKFKIKSFTSGFLVASFCSSLFIYGGTLIDGAYQFASGEVISASEMNHNFQLLRGNVLLDTTNTTLISHQIDSPTQQCESGVTGCASGYVEFGNETVGTIETRTDPSASTLHSATAQGNMSFITIPTDGFYEVTVLATPDAFTISPPDEAYENTRFEASFALIKFDSTDASEGVVLPNNSAMTTPRIDGSEVDSPLQSHTSLNKGDSTGDSAEDFYREEIEGGAKEQIYLKANDGLAVFYWIFDENYNAPVGTDNIQYGIGTIRLKIKRILD